ncbi:glycosyltransferase family 4 protein [Antarcticibacterium arcticum]|uniref:Glycosyltransferase family 4 protein n=1 Tax=Antarcticibacterium arcticum TaxID=2585771 RepID=A0A5B8YII4_9FLAO|nr:glycosyltransferase family 4 protein [Antarcticibacterium arcticum]QED37760.1 glycosyltransferase family 4 protein [Antarcticibacterium arcticum]
MKTIIFKIQEFPHLSETFIISQVIIAIKIGLSVNLLVKKKLDIDSSSHRDLIEQYKIEQKIILEDYKIPANKFLKTLNASWLFLKNINRLSELRKFYLKKKKFSLSWIFEYDFYQKFKYADIIHVQYGTNIHPVDILKTSGSIKGKLIVSFHGHDVFFPINGYIPNNGYYNNLFKGDNLIVANTPYLANMIKELGCPEENLRVIPVGVDTEFFSTNHNNIFKQGKVIQLLSVGRLEEIKGHHLGIKAVDELIKRGYNICYNIIGYGTQYGALEKLISSLSLKGKVHLLGSRSQQEIREQYWISDIFLMTSIPFGEMRESQGIVSLEAQASGLPVVAFDSGGVKNTIQNHNTGFVCEESNLNEYIDAVEKLILNPNLRKRMSQEAPKFIETNFSLIEISKRWKNIYLNQN